MLYRTVKQNSLRHGPAGCILWLVSQTRHVLDIQILSSPGWWSQSALERHVFPSFVVFLILLASGELICFIFQLQVYSSFCWRRVSSVLELQYGKLLFLSNWIVFSSTDCFILLPLLLMGLVPFNPLLLLGTFHSPRLEAFLYFNPMELRVHCGLSGYVSWPGPWWSVGWHLWVSTRVNLNWRW